MWVEGGAPESAGDRAARYVDVAAGEAVEAAALRLRCTQPSYLRFETQTPAHRAAAPTLPRQASARLQPQPRRRRWRPSRASSCERRARGIEQIQTAAIHFHADACPDAHIGEPGKARHQRLAAGIHVYQRFAPQRLDHQHIYVSNSLVDRAESNVFRPDSHLELALVSRQLDGNREAPCFDYSSLLPRPPSPPLQHIHSRRADKA